MDTNIATLFETSFYNERLRLTDSIDVFSKLLRENGEFELSNKLHEYLILRKTFMDNDSGTKKDLYEFIEDIYLHLIKTFPDLLLVCNGRIKSFWSSLRKFISVLSEERSLNNVKDLIGVRIVIHSNSKNTPVEQVDICYKVTFEIIKYLIENKFCMLGEASPLRTCADSKIETLTFPSKDAVSILDPYKDGIKDYIFSPKKSKYQSIHFPIKATQFGKTIEFQIRTSSMDFTAESDPAASHITYESEKYKGVPIEYIPEKLNIIGYRVSPKKKAQDGSIIPMNIFDNVGFHIGYNLGYFNNIL